MKIPEGITKENVHELLDALGFFGYKLWTREDVEAVVEDDYPHEGLSAKRKITDEAYTLLRNDVLLSDCTDSDWEIITDAVRVAKNRVMEEEAAFREAD